MQVGPIAQQIKLNSTTVMQFFEFDAWKSYTTGIIGVIGSCHKILGIFRDYIGYSILGLYWDNGKENGNYFCRPPMVSDPSSKYGSV